MAGGLRCALLPAAALPASGSKGFPLPRNLSRLNQRPCVLQGNGKGPGPAVKLYKPARSRQAGPGNHRMHDVFMALGVTAGAVALALLGKWLAQRPGRGWLWACLLALGVLGVTALGLNFRRLSFQPPMNCLVGGWGRWIVVSWIASFTLGTLITKLPRASTRRILWVLCGLIILRTATLPFLSPLFTKGTLRELTTQVDRDGVCLQGTPYNCGPAAAVTALRKLGFPAEEGTLGLISGTTAIIGTPDDMLVEALRRHYGPKGLEVEWRYVASVDELRAWPVALAVIRYNPFVDHYVTVLGFKGNDIIIGDPLSGKLVQPKSEFLQTWHHVAILLRRK